MSRRQVNDSVSTILVFMQEFGITRGDHENHILKTVGIAGCIAVTLYDRKSKVGAMVHFNPATQRGNNLALAFHGMLASMCIAGYKEEDRSSVEVRIIGGDEGRPSKGLLEGIQRRLFLLKLCNIVETDPNLDEGHKRIALDTQTGELFDLIRIVPLRPNSEDERVIDQMRATQAILPRTHYTYDTRAKAYEVYVYESPAEVYCESPQHV